MSLQSLVLDLIVLLYVLICSTALLDSFGALQLGFYYYYFFTLGRCYY